MYWENFCGRDFPQAYLYRQVRSISLKEMNNKWDSYWGVKFYENQEIAFGSNVFGK